MDMTIIKIDDFELTSISILIVLVIVLAIIFFKKTQTNTKNKKLKKNYKKNYLVLFIRIWILNILDIFNIKNKRNSLRKKIKLNMKKLSINLDNSKKIGGPTVKNYLYHNYNLPFDLGKEVFFHRFSTNKRIKKINDIVNIKDSSFLDIGSANGGISFGLMSYGASNVFGIELEKSAHTISKIIKEMYELKNIKFIHGDIASSKIPKVDYVIWLSNFMWIEKTYGFNKSIDILFDVINKSKCKGMIFESAAADGGAGVDGRTQDYVENLLKMYTPFKKITNYGFFDDNWQKPSKKRNIYFCENPSNEFNSKINHVFRLSSTKVRKLFKLDNLWGMKNEIRALTKLKKYKEFPTIINVGKNWFDMDLLGHNKSLVKYDYYQLKKIISILDSENIIHRDINPRNLLINNENIYLIDFEWAITDGNFDGPSKLPEGLGRGFYSSKLRNNYEILNKFKELDLLKKT